MISAFHKYGIPIVVNDLSVPAPATDLHADVSRIKASGADFVASCMDLSGNVLLSNTMAQEGVTGVTQYWFDGYDQSARRRSSARPWRACTSSSSTPRSR